MVDHLESQPFGQVPFLKDGGVRIFESGAGLLHIARKSEKLMPREATGAAETLQGKFATLNSIEIVTLPWWFLEISGHKDNGMAGWMDMRLGQLEALLSKRDWLAAGRFAAADLLIDRRATRCKAPCKR